jgi:hypothetical protein
VIQSVPTSPSSSFSALVSGEYAPDASATVIAIGAIVAASTGAATRSAMRPGGVPSSVSARATFDMSDFAPTSSITRIAK